VLEILADHPSTARFVARKLCRRFIADEGAVPASLVERLAGTFRKTDGDIRQILSVLLRSDEFRSGPQRKLKRPLDYVISALRALNADTNGRGALAHLRRMGQVPYEWAMPNGYPDHAEAWLPSLLGRWNFAVALVSNRIAGTRVSLSALLQSARAETPDEQLSVLERAILGGPLGGPDAGVLDAVFAGAPEDTTAGVQQAAALLLMSPAFQWR
jgi:uncharacterized protein (DUF1800 family)